MKTEEINRILERMSNAPEVEQRTKELSKLEAVRMMSSGIESMFQKGYTLEQISELMSSEGFTIAESTLKSYLNKIKGTKKGTRKRMTKVTKKAIEMGTKNTTKTNTKDTTNENKKVSIATFVPKNDTDDI